MGTRSIVLGAAAATAVLVWRRRSARGVDGERWLVVTVQRPPEEVAVDLPATLRTSSVEVEVRPAPGDRGSELAARARGRKPPRDELRSALREAKQVLEVGEVLRVDPQPAGRRSRTPATKVLAAVAGRAGKKGVL
ncbi:hypothetical protein PU560_11805 [Georgenia sp. 10Sc9-8]|uniref:Uncharacterized protein n=1 Tax=Georgenia halotolerans TaxID=3028317 RepID=A0ABT5TYJ8_9MICO|nr:hypothetical protein [Georgenia halotolerans]